MPVYRMSMELGEPEQMSIRFETVECKWLSKVEDGGWMVEFQKTAQTL